MEYQLRDITMPARVAYILVNGLESYALYIDNYYTLPKLFLTQGFVLVELHVIIGSISPVT